MIAHVVTMRLKARHDPAELAQVMQGLAALTGRIPGMLDFAHGPNLDLEGLSRGAGAGFVARFRDRAALAAYAADPGHRALGARLVALCRGGRAGLTVHDLEIAA